jgi:hypothetical protein
MTHPEQGSGHEGDEIGPGADSYANLGQPESQGINVERVGPGIEAEKSLLSEMQARQAEQLRAAGILDMAARKAAMDEDDPSVSAWVVEVTKRQQDGSMIDEVAVMLKAPAGDQYRFAEVPVAQTFAGMMMPVGEFNDQQAEAVAAMAQGLRESQEMGVLPHYERSSGQISDPRTSLGS